MDCRRNKEKRKAGGYHLSMTGKPRNTSYWDRVAVSYQRHTQIATDDFHYGPLLAGDRWLRLLPERLTGLRCLEVGCGAGQNSIYLARHGARCVALDASSRQIEIGERLARRCRIAVDYRCQTMETLPDSTLGRFDLVHSVHALPFADDPARTLEAMARMLKAGGMLLLATAHPLSAAEPVRVGRGRTALLLTDYFHPEPDRRGGRGGWPEVCATTLPFAVLLNAVIAAGLRIERIEEPEPPPIPEMSATAVRRTIPYQSRAWRERYRWLVAAPYTLIIRAVKLTAP